MKEVIFELLTAIGPGGSRAIPQIRFHRLPQKISIPPNDLTEIPGMRMPSRQVRRVVPGLASPPAAFLEPHLELWGFWKTGILGFWVAADAMDCFVAIKGHRGSVKLG